MINLKTKPERSKSTIRTDLLEILDNIFPEDMIELSGVAESYLIDIYDPLLAQLNTISIAKLDFERDWTGEDPNEDVFSDSTNWDGDGSTLGENNNTMDAGNGDPYYGSGELQASYHLFFFGLKDKKFTYECEDEIFTDDGRELQVPGKGTIGCSVAISLLAPVAVIMPNSMQIYEDGMETEPDIFATVFKPDGNPENMEAHYIELAGDGAPILKDLYNQIARILESFSIIILPEEELKKNVPWLKPATGICLNDSHLTQLTLQDAFFFRGIY